LRNKALLFAILLAVVFAAGLTEIFLLRFESGEVYPEYSSLRSDPRGTRAFFESLALVPGLEVRRHREPLSTLKNFDGTLFYLGVSPKSNIEEATKIAAGGARVVLGFLPPDKPPAKAQRLFEETAKGKGTLVILHNCYWLSNEAMLKNRNPDLLAELIGPSQKIVFDESHLGVIESGSLMALARKYGLGGFALATLLVLGLFIWKNSTSLLPPFAEADPAAGVVRGRDANAGFVNLLRRSVPRAALMETAYEQWRATIVMNRNYPESKLQLAAEAAKERDAVAAYRKIAGILRQRGSA
jgi:hypothetical protein